MSKTSWLAKAKSIHDLGGHFYLPKSGTSWDEKREALADRKHLELLRKPLPVESEFVPFFGSRMHDSWLIGIERTPEVLKVKLDSIDADIFAIGLADFLGVERSTEPWPVDLLFQDPIYVRAARHDPSGNLRYADWRSAGNEPGERRIQFLSDWFHEQDGRLQWIADIWSWRKESGKLSSSLYLMVDCTSATAVDRREAALVNVFGPSAGLLWRDALNGIDVGDAPYGPWSVPTMESFIVRRVEHYGLTIASFAGRQRESNF